MISRQRNTLLRTSLLFTVIVLLAANSLLALPSRPTPPRLVNDFEQLLTPAEIVALENKLVDYAASHPTQIAVVITSNLYGFEISDFSTRLGTEWGIGTKGQENGVLITVVPRAGKGDVYIAVGYGLESVIPDITAKRIVENEILPRFRNGEYYNGLDAATGVLMQIASGEFPANEYAPVEPVPPGAVIAPLIFFLIIFVLMSRKRRHFSSPGKDIPLWSLFWLLSHGNRGSSGSFGNFSSGRGSFGRTGGSSFGGFGGGRFGGGGAGGSW
jgi:uncharacterized protein